MADQRLQIRIGNERWTLAKRIGSWWQPCARNVSVPSGFELWHVLETTLEEEIALEYEEPRVESLDPLCVVGKLQ